jgi:hypothetical protein
VDEHPLRNVKAIAAAGQLTTFAENPEITAMAAICEILQALPDDAARMRVMRWSFGRFGDEFKRPLAEPQIERAAPPVQAPPRPAPVAPLRAMRPNPPMEPAKPVEPAKYDASDLADQISELSDLFPDSTPRFKPRT